MLLSLIIVLFLVVVIFVIFSKRGNTSKNQYADMVAKHKSSSSTKRKATVNSQAINQNFSQENVKPPSDTLNKVTQKSEVPEGFLDFKVFNADELDEEQKQVIQDISQSFRKPHPLLLPLTQRSFEPNELFDLIKTDTEMTAKVLNAVNSPLFALQQPITNINHAIIFLGVGKVKNIVMQFAMQQGMEFKNKHQNEAYNKLWKASYLASSFCLLFAKELSEDNAAELATHCLLSYLGDLAILSYKPQLAGFYLDDFTLFERTKIFQESLNTNAAVVGKFLASQWRLPSTIESGIEHSILPLTNCMTTSELSDKNLRQLLLCYLACRLGDLVAFNGLKEVPEFKEVSFEALGEIEFYYTQTNIQNSDFKKVNSVIADIGFRKKLNKIISEVA